MKLTLWQWQLYNITQWNFYRHTEIHEFQWSPVNSSEVQQSWILVTYFCKAVIWSHIFLRVRVCTGLLTISMSGFNKLNWMVQVRLNSSMSVKFHWGKYVAKVTTFNCYGISPGTYNALWDTGTFKIPGMIKNYWLFFCPWSKPRFYSLIEPVK